jgi:hypothetical protein
VSIIHEPPTTSLFLVDDLEDVSRTANIDAGDLHGLRVVADWITTFVARPHEDLGRAGPVCPFVPDALDAKTLWLAPEQIVHRSIPDLVARIDGYKQLFLHKQPVDGEAADYKALVIVFTDLPSEAAKDFFDDLERDIKVPSYVDDGLVLGEFYRTNTGTALYNPQFRPFTPPVPFLLMRHAVVGDWKFFLDNEEWLGYWAHRFGDSAVHALAAELRQLPWRSLGT